MNVERKIFGEEQRQSRGPSPDGARRLSCCVSLAGSRVLSLAFAVCMSPREKGKRSKVMMEKSAASGPRPIHIGAQNAALLHLHGSRAILPSLCVRTWWDRQKGT